MQYNFFVANRMEPSSIARALGECLCVPSHEVDVADAFLEQDNRNWDAKVLCDYAHASGDVSLSLDIYVQDSVAVRPSEAELARTFARTARSVVLYPAEEGIPSAYWLASPSNVVTRARLLASDDDNPAHTIDAVETAVPELPQGRVIVLPEIIREHPVPTPTTAAFTRSLDNLAAARPELFSTCPVDEPGSLHDDARAYLGEWERMVRRMVADWPPAGRYPVEMYRDAIEARDRLSDIEDRLITPSATLLTDALEEVDGQFLNSSAEDTKHILAKAVGMSAFDLPPGAWWWHRLPLSVPW
ncbi:hypothetical protein [Streptomyces sp. NPDC048639]|uniref:hypothetical protein n=1 Tax=Streptomyces sp. NPDC048639 TaxID=3365581 RepID=UPI0037163FAE